MENGSLIDATRTVKSITQSFSLPQDLIDVLQLIERDAEIIVSNTADAGYAPQEADGSTEFSVGMSYPAKLAWFLHRRFLVGGKPIQIMPCELIPRNGDVLKDLVLAQADLYSANFRDWLNSEVLWINSLVDRIVSEPLEPAGAVAEPYALWAIENQPGLKLPCTHPDIQVVDDLELVETLKLFILNLGHTYMVARWLRTSGNRKHYVREVMSDPDDLADLEDLYRREVIPGIGNLGREVPDEDAVNVLHLAWQSGIRYFDTAPHYGRGLAEKRLGAFLKPHDRSSVVVSTKVGRVLTPGRPLSEADGFVKPLPNDVHYDYSGDGIEAALEGSMERLQTRYIDIVYVHDIGSYTHGRKNEGHRADLLGSGLDRLARLKAKGTIGAFGLGVNETEICLDLMNEARLDAILLAGRLTLLDRSAEEKLVAECRKQSVSLVLGGIFNSGILATGPVEGAWFDYEPASEDILQKL
eukprot:g994.t1